MLHNAGVRVVVVNARSIKNLTLGNKDLQARLHAAGQNGRHQRRAGQPGPQQPLGGHLANCRVCVTVTSVCATP
jgi:hypothetical protein